MHRTQKGNSWYYGMQVQSGVDSRSGYVHIIIGTAANVHDIDETESPICEDDEVIYDDSGYSEADKRDEIKNDEHLSSVECCTNKRPSSIKVPDSYKGINGDKQIGNRKSST